MYSTELIRKFPESPDEPILFVVYNSEMVDDARFLIATIWGEDYLEEHVTVVPFKGSDKYPVPPYQVYIDPVVYTYKHSWND